MLRINTIVKGAVSAYSIVLIFHIGAFTQSSTDLTLIGHAQFNTGLGSIGIGIIDTLSEDIAINHVSLFGKNTFVGVPAEVANVLKSPAKVPGNVALLYHPVYEKNEYKIANSVKSHIRLAFSMLESTKIPEKWVHNFNENFDAVIVPNDWLKEVYYNCGVTKPVFVLPHGINLKDFLNEPIKKAPSTPFRFGCNAIISDRKNQHLLIDAFREEFAGDPHVELMIHGRNGDPEYFKKAQEKINAHKVPAVHIMLNNDLAHKEYIKLMKSIDCYVLISKGEGFSITPREALALGIPTIVSNNTAHITLCNSGYVYGVPSHILNKAHYPKELQLGDCGDNFNCRIEDVRKAMREVYTHYEEYKKRALEGREWVKRYTWKSLKNKFLTMVKPKKVILGSENTIGEDFIITSSQELYKKYRAISLM